MITGRIKLIKEEQSFPSGFTKREFVVTTEDQYPQDLALEFIKDKCAVLDKYKEGDRVNVEYNLRGSEYNGRYFVNLQAWKIDKAEGEAQAVSSSQNIGSQPVEDDLPF